MKHPTRYLFGKPRSYFEPELSELAEKKIKSAKEIKQKLAKLKYEVSPEELPALAARYIQVESAQKHWEDILNEPEE